MRTVEQHWQAYEDYGFIKKRIPGGYRYSLPPHLGEGGFELWGDITSCFAVLCDALFYKPCIMLESVQEKTFEFGQQYAGRVSYYKRRAEAYPIENGLNYWVNYPLYLSGYKRMDASTRLFFAGICYREKFFETLPYTLPDDFWETASAVLNPDVIDLPSVSAICEQIRTCRLTGTQLEIFVQGKCLEAFALTLNYIYTHRGPDAIRLSAHDRAALEQAKALLERDIRAPIPLKELASAIGMNQKKMMAGFKLINGVTIYGYSKRLRMERALELLQTDEMSIAQIAQAVGYQGDGHFQQSFKNTYGTTPGRLRRELLSKRPPK
jgi:AraC-like DNA-binding protein